jgi:hypothetical protein
VAKFLGLRDKTPLQLQEKLRNLLGWQVFKKIIHNFSITSGAGAPTAVQNRRGKVGSQR